MREQSSKTFTPEPYFKAVTLITLIIGLSSPMNFAALVPAIFQRAIRSKTKVI